MAPENAQYLSALHKQIDRYFSFSEVKTLCFDLGVDYENIPGDSRSAFIRNLVVSLAKRNQLQELVDKVKGERGFVDWKNVPTDFELPASIAQEDIQQIVQYTVYGDVVQGDKIEGDSISVGNISNATGVAIGGGASAHLQKTTIPPTPAQQPSAATDVTIQQAVDKLNRYLQMASGEYKNMADKLAASVNIILAVAAKQPTDFVHLNLLCLGQAQLAQQLTADIPGIEKVVAGFVTAVSTTSSIAE